MTENLDTQLMALAKEQTGVRVTDQLTDDVTRGKRFCCEAAGIRLDYSKHRLNDEVIKILCELASHSQLPEGFAELTSGTALNVTEARPALHTLLRGFRAEAQADRYAEVVSALETMRQLVDSVHSGSRLGFSGLPFKQVVNIGIGGSDFGPRLMCRALRMPTDPLKAHFVANVDPQDIDETLAQLDPGETLFIVCSKSFSTEETLTNALRARDWLLAAGAQPEHIAQHMVAVTTNVKAASEFGIATSECLPMWDWVGGRYSVWSAVGLAVALQCGWAGFEALLAGARDMDEHTRSAVGRENLPLMLALLEYWNTRFLGTETHLVLPYSQRLELLTDFLQQLSMESNGKRVQSDGSPVRSMSAPVLWGSAGTIGQHSYFQLLHQGTRPFTADIILPLTNPGANPDGHRKLAANALAQSRALLTGRDHQTARELATSRQQPEAFAPHYEMPGNHSHSMITFHAVSPTHLGALVAAYEHKTFFLAQLLGINAFDQWGVELGKVIGKQVLQTLQSGEGLDALDTATAAIAEAWREANPSEE